MSVPNMLLPRGSVTLAAALAAAALAAAALDAAALAAVALAANKTLAATAALATTALATAAFPATATLTFAPVALRAAALPEQPLVFALAGMKCIASGLRAFAHTFLFASRSSCYRARLLCKELAGQVLRSLRVRARKLLPPSFGRLSLTSELLARELKDLSTIAKRRLRCQECRAQLLFT